MCSRTQMMASPDPLRVRGVWHVCPCRLLHGLLVELVFRERSGAKWTDPERGGDADFRYGRLRGGRCAGRCRRTREDIYKRWKKSQSFGHCSDILETTCLDLTCQNVSSEKKKKVWPFRPLSVRCRLAISPSRPDPSAALSAIAFRELRGSGAWGGGEMRTTWEHAY